MPADLPRVVNVIACPPAQCTCGKCGAETAVIGYEESERLDVEPAKFFVTVTRREKRACRSCKQSGVATAPVVFEATAVGVGDVDDPPPPSAIQPIRISTRTVTPPPIGIHGMPPPPPVVVPPPPVVVTAPP